MGTVNCRWYLLLNIIYPVLFFMDTRHMSNIYCTVYASVRFPIECRATMPRRALGRWARSTWRCWTLQRRSSLLLSSSWPTACATARCTRTSANATLSRRPTRRCATWSSRLAARAGRLYSPYNHWILQFTTTLIKSMISLSLDYNILLIKEVWVYFKYSLCVHVQTHGS